MGEQKLFPTSARNLPLPHHQAGLIEIPDKIQIFLNSAKDAAGATFSPGRRWRLQTSGKEIPPCQSLVGKPSPIWEKRCGAVEEAIM